jgi:hypothetical protein
MTDHSAVASLSVAAAAAPSSPPSLDETNASFSITESMVSFLRIEAHHADDKAKRLRKQAAEIAEQFGITEESQQIYGTYVLYCDLLYSVVWIFRSMAVVEHSEEALV